MDLFVTSQHNLRKKIFIGFGLWCLMPLSTIFHWYRGSQFMVEEIWVCRENYRPVAIHWQTLSHNVVSSTPRLSRVRTHNGSGDRHWLHQSNYHTTTMAPIRFWKLFKDLNTREISWNQLFKFFFNKDILLR